MLRGLEMSTITNQYLEINPKKTKRANIKEYKSEIF